VKYRLPDRTLPPCHLIYLLNKINGAPPTIVIYVKKTLSVSLWSSGAHTHTLKGVRASLDPARTA
jgi:hypothetical protein